MNRFLIAAISTVVCVGFGSSALAFEPGEHKLIGDRGAAQALRAHQMGGKKASQFPWPGKVGNWAFWGPGKNSDWTYDQAGSQKLAGKTVVGWGKWYWPNHGHVLYAPQDTGDTLAVWVGDEDEKNGKWMTFGDLVAIYGDLSDNPDELLSNDANYNETLKTHVGEQAEAPSWEVSRYLSRASVNEDHFSVGAVAAYRKWHFKAIKAAYEAVQDFKNNIPARNKKMNLALHYEARANHNLTDLFSAGHLFSDRKENVAMTNDALDYIMQINKPDGIVGLVTKFFKNISKVNELIEGCAGSVVDRLMHDGYNYCGADVKNLRKKEWRLYGDARFTMTAQHGKDETYGAVETSIRSLLDAFEGFLAGDDEPQLHDSKYYQALRYIPVLYKDACTYDLLSNALTNVSLTDWPDLRTKMLKVPAMVLSIVGTVVPGAGGAVAKVLSYAIKAFAFLKIGEQKEDHFNPKKSYAKIQFTCEKSWCQKPSPNFNLAHAVDDILSKVITTYKKTPSPDSGKVGGPVKKARKIDADVQVLLESNGPLGPHRACLNEIRKKKRENIIKKIKECDEVFLQAAHAKCLGTVLGYNEPQKRAEFCWKECEKGKSCWQKMSESKDCSGVGWELPCAGGLTCKRDFLGITVGTCTK
ncbi:MAG: hypothetical protein HYY84_00590 [Deltaproteobacteria bacterium]|nr:hypothetical protein [Deltaproteobacteria bacterium]